MLRFAHLVLLGLFGAAAVHLAILFLLPAYSERDMWSALAAKHDLYTFTRLGKDDANALLAEKQNPFLEVAACRFDLENGMTWLSAETRVPFWSFSVYDRDGINVFNVNDRGAESGKLDALIMNAPQLLELRKEMPEMVSTSLIAQTDLDEGIVVVRVFQPDKSWRATIERFFQELRCSAL